MFVSQLKVAGSVLLALTLVGAGAGYSHHVLAAGGAAPTATSPDGKLVATGDDKSITVADAGTGKVLFKLAGHTGKVTALAFSPDGKTLASGGADKAVRFWDVASGKEIRRLEGKDTITSLTYAKDGKTLTAKEGDKVKRTWDVATGKEVP
jgi:WD40 repeat protein